jgi:hypothetical protein
MRYRTADNMAGRGWWRRVVRSVAAGVGVALVAAGAPLVTAPTASAHPCHLAEGFLGPHNHTRCEHMDLRAYDFTGKDLSWGIFTGSNFSGMHLSNVNLSHANLKYAQLRGVKFIHSLLARVKLQHADLEDLVRDVHTTQLTELTNGSLLISSNVSDTRMMPKSYWPGPIVTVQQLWANTRPIRGTHLINCHQYRGITVQFTAANSPYTIRCEFTDDAGSVKSYGSMQLTVTRHRTA